MWTSTIASGSNTSGSPWLVSDPCSAAGAPGGQWTGVTCAGLNVIGLSLPSNNMLGTLPASLSALTGLTYVCTCVLAGMTQPLASQTGY